MLNKLASYFSLARPVLGGKGVDRQFALFTGVMAGAVGQWLFTTLRSDGHFQWDHLTIGLIASVVTFPAIYYNAGLDQTKLTFVKWCVAFQSGFFWPSLLEQVGKGFK